MRPVFAFACLALLAAASPSPAPQPSAALAAAVDGSVRTPADRARDQYRHPAETLAFFDVRPGQTVVELYPSAGWYMRILAPLEAKGGHYIAAVSPGDKAALQAHDLFQQNAEAFGHPELVAWDAKAGGEIAPAGTVDRVLTFRNIHNLLMAGTRDGNAPAFFAAAYRALKPGGILGVVEHHLPEAMDSAREKTTGYVKRSTIIRLAAEAGLRLAGESDVNANPKDTHDWPKGVWTLPPTYDLGDEDKAKYAAIGESDRLTLKFVKPAR